MTRIFDNEALQNRAQNLGGLNGIRLVFVSLAPPAMPTDAWLDLEFHNANWLGDILNEITANGVPPTAIFTIRGGIRIRGGEQPGQLQVLEVTAGAKPEILRLRLQPIGDYSTYTLAVRYDDHFDPISSEIRFKFRPGCFNLNCPPSPAGAQARPIEPVIDYLAKDYDSFKHVLINAMRDRVPGWQPTSEADLDQVIIDLIASDGDELSDFQDRVSNEAYLGRARKRVSIARYGRLMDYHLHQGNQASTWQALRVSIPDVTISVDFGVWSTLRWQDEGAVIFKAEAPQRCLRILNEVALYTWSDAVIALEAGSTEAELALPPGLNPALEADADDLVDTLRSPEFRYLLIQEHLNPETGRVPGVDPSARQVVRLLDGPGGAEKVFDPLAGQWLVRVHWQDSDKLQRRYCFVTSCPNVAATEGVSAFHGNLIRMVGGRPYRTIFRPPGSPLAGTNASGFLYQTESHFETTERWGTICRLPEGPLAYRNTPPGGDTATRSTLQVAVDATGEPWTEQSDLIESESDAKDFNVETDEMGQSLIRFGNGINGEEWDETQAVRCFYQVGGGAAGNVGPDSLTRFDTAVFAVVSETWNPLDVTDGRDPETAADAIRRIPEAYRSRQLRAVTLQDYVQRAKELPGVSNAYARYAWTGSWRTVRVLIDPAGTDTLTAELSRQIELYLDAVRLIGEDLEIRAAQYVSLDIKVKICIHSDYWPEDLIDILDQEFSDGFTPDGRMGFFHPDLWTFGQPLYESQLIGRALAVQGVERVLLVSIRRFDGLIGPSTTTIVVNPDAMPDTVVEKIEVRAFEVIRVANDPNQMEKGRILFEVLGGRR